MIFCHLFPLPLVFVFPLTRILMGLHAFHLDQSLLFANTNPILSALLAPKILTIFET